MSWFVLYIFSRKEKKIHEHLSKMGIESFLPLIKIRKQWSDRKKWVEEPLFKSYLFVKASSLKLEDCLRLPGVLYLVKFKDGPAILSDQDVENIRISITQPEYLSKSNDVFSPGQKVIVTDGPFKGLYGNVERLAGKTKIHVSLDKIGQTLLLELPAGFIIDYKATQNVI
jgi:transcription antitermination factor NusG